MTVFNLVIMSCIFIAQHPTQCETFRIKTESAVKCSAKAYVINKKSRVRMDNAEGFKKAPGFAYCETEGSEDVNPYDAIVDDYIKEQMRKSI